MYLNSFFNIFLYPIPDPTKNMEYPTFVCIREEQGTLKVSKSFLSMTSAKLFDYNISSDALKQFNIIFINNF